MVSVVVPVTGEMNGQPRVTREDVLPLQGEVRELREILTGLV